MKHTPGPWTYWRTDKTGEPAYINVGIPKIRFVAEVYCGSDTKVEDEANARLIAAAPVGYAANVLALRLLEFTFGDEGPEAAQQAIFALRAAIAKAEGRE